MAGFLTPTIGDIGSAPGGFSAPVDTTVGDLLTNVGSLISMGVTGRKEEGGTQTKRDRELLKPIAQKALGLTESFRSGKLTNLEYKTRLNQLFSESLSTLPDKSNEIKRLFSSITGEEYGEELPSIEQGTQQAILEFVMNPDNPEGNQILLESIVVDKNGNIDPELTKAKIFENIAQLQADKARVARLGRELEALKTEENIKELVQESEVEGFVARAHKRVSDAVEGILKTVAKNPNIIEGRESAITQLMSLRTQYLTQFEQLALEAGILDNIQNKFNGGLNVVVSSIDNTIKFLEQAREEDINKLKALDARDNLILAEVFRKLGIPQTLRSSEYTEAMLVNAMTKEINQIPSEFRKILETSGDTPADKLLGDEERIDLNGDPTEKVQEVSRNMSKDEKVETVVKSSRRFLNIDKDLIKNPKLKRQAVEEFIVATEVINNLGLPISEDTFDTIYNSEFIEKFELYKKTGGAEADILEKAVTKNLSKILAQRTVAANVKVKSFFKDTLPNLNIVFNGEKFIIDIDESLVSSEVEQNFLKALEKTGNELSIDGIRRFSKEFPLEAASFGLDVFDQGFEELQRELRFLNKIVGFTKRLPENIFETVFGNKQQSKGITVLPDSEEEALKIYRQLPNGAKYRVKMKNGQTIVLEKGNEQSLISTP